MLWQRIMIRPRHPLPFDTPATIGNHGLRVKKPAISASSDPAPAWTREQAQAPPATARQQKWRRIKNTRPCGPRLAPAVSIAIHQFSHGVCLGLFKY
jgi:hypothetical protein